MPIRHKEMMERHVLGKLHAIVALVCLAPLAFALLQQLPCVEANVSFTLVTYSKRVFPGGSHTIGHHLIGHFLCFFGSSFARSALTH